jgi:cation transport ATPase
MKTEKYEISGMSCAACQANVERSVRRQAGVEKADVSLLANEMTVTYDPEKLTQAQIVQAVTEAGYGARAAGSTQNRRSGFRGAWESRAKRAEEVQQGMKRRLSWSIALLLPLMYLSMGSMLSLPAARLSHRDGKPLRVRAAPAGACTSDSVSQPQLFQQWIPGAAQTRTEHGYAGFHRGRRVAAVWSGGAVPHGLGAAACGHGPGAAICARALF